MHFQADNHRQVTDNESTVADRIADITKCRPLGERVTVKYPRLRTYWKMSRTILGIVITGCRYVLGCRLAAYNASQLGRDGVIDAGPAIGCLLFFLQLLMLLTLLLLLLMRFFVVRAATAATGVFVVRVSLSIPDVNLNTSAATKENLYHVSSGQSEIAVVTAWAMTAGMYIPRPAATSRQSTSIQERAKKNKHTFV